MSRRLVDLAREAGLEPGELRAYLLLEIDRAVRGRQRAATARDVELFRDDPGYVGRGPQTLSAMKRER